MDFLIELFVADSIAHTVFILSLVIALGLAFGSVRIAGIRLGVAGVLFAGLLFGHLQFRINAEILHFIKEFGLILFVYTIGLQVGPGFFASLKKNGLKLNALAVLIVTSGVLLAVLMIQVFKVPVPAAVGLLAGATTNTPSLGAAQQALQEVPGVAAESLTLPGLGYAVAYPFGILGIILTMILTRIIFRIDPVREDEEVVSQLREEQKGLEYMDLRVENVNLNGLMVRQIPGVVENDLVISRIQNDEEIKTARPDSRVYVGNIVRVVGSKDRLNRFQLIAGTPQRMEMRGRKTRVVAEKAVVTQSSFNGKTLKELNVRERFGVTVTRISRAEIEFAASPETELRFADTLTVVGEAEDVARFAQMIGNAKAELDHPLLIPVFVGIALGVVVGSIPFSIPGMSSSVKLGLAGGPLLVAIVLSRIGYIGRLVWYMPTSANFMLREIGITLFLAAVGISSGATFLNTLVNGRGLEWMALAAGVTFIPLIVTAVIARVFMKINYLTLCGVLAGSLTDPPALAYANTLAKSNAAAIGYATVYPLVMLLRVISTQVLVIWFMGVG